MSILAKKLHILKDGGPEETAVIYTTTSECPEPNLKVSVDGANGYVKLGAVNHQYATSGRVHRNSDNSDYAILKLNAVSDFPLEWGKFKKFACALTSNEARTDYMYGWSLHFENGTLPIPVGYKAAGSSVSWSADNYEAVTKDSLNCCWYNKQVTPNKWVNATAIDDSNFLEWLKSDNTNLGNISKSTATAWGWPEQGGEPSVYTSAFTATVSNGVLTIKKNGNVFKTYNVYV
ncbi:MAG: hypothetical protein J6N49_03185 [Alphaproteobacteria bacterium]|nr:hypothetical protein [Alphaproteobacteria bacterium]